MSITVDEFEAARPHLLSVAQRMLGSIQDAEDAVQTAWLRTATLQTPAVENPTGWLTTVTARVCLDQLRARQRRKEAPLLADAIPDQQLSADEAFLQKESVSRALMVLLSRLTPGQRVAYVLHDLFAVPFDQVAQVLESTVAGAKKHASRARQHLRVDRGSSDRTCPADDEIVAAFLAAAQTGDTRAMIRLLAPDSVRNADAALLPPGAPTVVTGVDDIATETGHFRDRIRATCRIVVNGVPTYLIAPGGHPMATIQFETGSGQITTISLRRVQLDDHFAAA